MKTLFTTLTLISCLFMSGCKEEISNQYDFTLMSISGTDADKTIISGYVFETKNCINGNRMLNNDQQAKNLFISETAKLVEQELKALPLTEEASFEYGVLRQADPTDSQNGTRILIDSYSFDKK